MKLPVSSKYVNPLTGIDKVIAGFKNPQLTKSFPKVHDFNKISDQILWVLWIIGEKFTTIDYVPPEWLSEILVEGLRISCTPEKAKKALATIGGKAHPKKFDDQTFYKIMEKGITYLREISGVDKPTMYKIGGNTPRQDKQFLTDVIKKSKGEIKIVDPYYGTKSLLNIEKFISGKKVKLLSVQLDRNEKSTTFQSELNDFKKQHATFEIRIFPNNPRELHDRYILTKGSVIFVGHGIKDFGGKESFILVFHGESGKSILDDLNRIFEDRWNKSTPL